jgi:hypothetical protein
MPCGKFGSLIALVLNWDGYLPLRLERGERMDSFLSVRRTGLCRGDAAADRPS